MSSRQLPDIYTCLEKRTPFEIDAEFLLPESHPYFIDFSGPNILWYLLSQRVIFCCREFPPLSELASSLKLLTGLLHPGALLIVQYTCMLFLILLTTVHRELKYIAAQVHHGAVEFHTLLYTLL